MIAPSGEGGGGDGAKGVRGGRRRRGREGGGERVREGMSEGGGNDKEVGYTNKIQLFQDTIPVSISSFMSVFISALLVYSSC